MSGPADLVLSGGGVKGVGLVGAVVALMDAGYRAQRVSGTSAGSIVGAIVAAADAQLTGAEFKDIALQLNYRKFRDATLLGRIPFVGQPLALAHGRGIYKGDYAHDWVRAQLADLGVRTFGDLAIDDDELPADRRYRLVVTVADITTGQLVRLPWDYRRVYGLDPDDQPVAAAVRASMSIPFYFRPSNLTDSAGRTSTLVDGGLLSNFPIDSLDRADGGAPRWPSFGVTVLPNLPNDTDHLLPNWGPLRRFGTPRMLDDVITTVLVGRDQAYLNQPWVKARTVRVDSTEVGYLDFDISDAEVQALYAAGYAAASGFLADWDWNSYLQRFRPARQLP
ncbi:patatin-like phospholipase family protein [Mycobacterium sp. AMU20-3851]|uniref:patatin-like phospholipase family protein n=1 Tax=Mycobacterium sp. AMU20-3851 TaxID=3122055 RepID=UPI003754F52A